MTNYKEILRLHSLGINNTRVSTAHKNEHAVPPAAAGRDYDAAANCVRRSGGAGIPQIMVH